MSLESRVKKLERKVRKLERSSLLSNIEPLVSTSQSEKSCSNGYLYMGEINIPKKKRKPDFGTIEESRGWGI